MRQTHTFVLRVLLDHEQTAELRGQISEPTAVDEWRASFGDVNELLRQLIKRVAAAPGEGDVRCIPIADIAEMELALRRVEPLGQGGNCGN